MKHRSKATTLIVRLDAKTRRRLESFARVMKRSESFLARETISSYVEICERGLVEIQAGLSELDSGKRLDGAKVEAWLKTWGRGSETHQVSGWF